MTTTPQTWFCKAADTLRTLAARPRVLFCLLLALNAAARPYGNFIHDARLYSFQVLNQVEGNAFADDLFLRFGSQDQYSLFAAVTAPLAATLGLELTFFLLYLLFNTLLILAMKRLVETLIRDRVVSTLGLAFLMVAPLNFGGLSVFHVHEPFLTPRIMANALVLFALERTLRERFGSAIILLVFAGLLHPLMACGGFLVWGVCLAVRLLSTRHLLILGVGTLGIAATVLACPPLGFRIFGAMDEPWRDAVLRASAYNFPSEWSFADWLNVAVSLGMALAAWALWRRHHPLRARFVAVLFVVGFAGLVGTVLGAQLPYALFFQGQPYRALWLLKVLEAPLAFLVIVHLYRAFPRLAPLPSALLAAYLCMNKQLPFEIYFPFILLPLTALCYRGLERVPRRQDWLWPSLGMSVLVGFWACAAFKIGLMLTQRESLLVLMEVHDFARALLTHLGVVGWLLIFLSVAGRLLHYTGRTARLAGAVLGVALAVQTAFFVIPSTTYYQKSLSHTGADIDFVKSYLQQRDILTPPTIYCSLGRIDQVWIDLHAKSYYDWAQVVGVLFSRQTALEGQRRAVVVGPFEIETAKKYLPFMTEQRKHEFASLYRHDLAGPPPGPADLARLCREAGLDFVVLPLAFDGLYAASNGHIYVYDCRQVRAALGLPDPAHVAAQPQVPPRVTGPLSQVPVRNVIRHWSLVTGPLSLASGPCSVAFCGRNGSHEPGGWLRLQGTNDKGLRTNDQ